MPDADCVAFLQWALPRLGKRWPGYRKVRRQVCRRARRRAAQLGLDGLGAYRDHLERNPGEWEALDALTRITISRFYRDRGVFEALVRAVLPALAERARRRGAGALRAWSAGCASGEEAYTLSIGWALELAGRFPELRIEIVATDIEASMLARAERACYSSGSLRELPESWRLEAFTRHDGEWCVRPRFRDAVTVARHDVRDEPPDGPYDLILCRYLAFTYFAEPAQREVLSHFAHALPRGGALVHGTHERLPGPQAWFSPWPGAGAAICRRVH